VSAEAFFLGEHGNPGQTTGGGKKLAAPSALQVGTPQKQKGTASSAAPLV
jgi:hypothetical protein